MNRFNNRGACALAHSLLLAALVAAPSAQAQGADASAAEPHSDKPAELDTLTIQGDPLGRTSDELVQPVEVLAGEELVVKRRRTLGETLELEPGVAVSDFGLGAGRPVIRGQGGPRVQVLHNGIGSLDVSDVSPDHAVTVSPAQATQIEIVKGPATLLYGSSAAGGVVNVHDDRLPRDPVAGVQGVLETFYGTNGDARAVTGSVNAGAGRHVLHLDFGTGRSGDYDIPGNARTDGSGAQGLVPNSATDTRTGALSWGFVDGGSSVAGSVSTHASTYGLPAEATAFIDMKQTRYDVQGLLDRPWPGVESLRLRGAYNDYEHTEFEDAGVPGTVFHNQQHQERLELVHGRSAWRGVVGLQYGQRDFVAAGDEAYVPSSQSSELGVFVLQRYAYRLGALEAGARVEQNRVDPAADSGQRARRFTPTSVSLGAVFDLNPVDHLKLYATRAQRAPAREELYAFGPHVATQTYERGAADARVETANNFEIGFDHHAGRLTWEASAFYETFDDYLYLDTNDEGCDAGNAGCGAGSDGAADRVDENGTFNAAGEFLLVDYRQADARFYGLEAQAGADLLTGPLRLRLTLLGDLVRGRLDSGANLARVAPSRFGGGLELATGPFEAGVTLVRVNGQDRIAPLETATGGHALLSAHLNWHVRPKVQLYLQGHNLLDEDVRRHTSFIKDAVPQPGIGAIVGLRAEL